MDATRPWILERAARTPSRPALRFEGDVLDFATIAEGAQALARDLIGAGVREGDVVAALVGNDPAAVLLAHAAPLAGITLLPLNARLPAPELAFQLDDADAALLVHGPGALAALATDAARGKFAMAALHPDGRLDAKGASGAADRVLRDRLDLQETFAILYTSGTTGRPKGAMLTYDNFLASAEASAAHLGSESDDDWLAALPLFHVGGLSILTRSVWMGTRVTVQPRFDPVAMNHALDADDITLVSLVATMLRRLLDARGDARAPTALRCVLLGGGPAPDALIERAEALGFPIAPTYGLTEATSQVATRRPGAGFDVGLAPLPGVEVRVVDDAGRLCEVGREGEICVRGRNVMRGYHARPEATADALRDGWLHTGDVGALDARGDLRVLDRRSDLIVSGGENVYPAQVEAVLEAHEDVAEAGVIGAPDPDWGERPTAVLVAREGAAPTPEALTAHCRERLAGYAVPVAFRFVAELPRTAAGKLQRRRLAERGEEGGPPRARRDG